ncbi:MAG: hypothetical protein FD153_110 [Rhodospirillaceae bacterium]|nr:MAG: hypothetical protein FD153_110 [Rhodospirillaceae bacterium]
MFKPKIPRLPPLPPPVSMAPPPLPPLLIPQPGQKAQLDDEADAAIRRRGQSGTILTSPLGLLAPANAPRKTLLGQ